MGVDKSFDQFYFKSGRCFQSSCAFLLSRKLNCASALYRPFHTDCVNEPDKVISCQMDWFDVASQKHNQNWYLLNSVHICDTTTLIICYWYTVCVSCWHSGVLMHSELHSLRSRGIKMSVVTINPWLCKLSHVLLDDILCLESRSSVSFLPLMLVIKECINPAFSPAPDT